MSTENFVWFLVSFAWLLAFLSVGVLVGSALFRIGTALHKLVEFGIGTL